MTVAYYVEVVEVVIFKLSAYHLEDTNDVEANYGSAGWF